jgi:hypothetical protein
LGILFCRGDTVPKRYAYSFTLAALVALAIGFAFQADAGLLVFNDRESWQANLGSANTPYTFNGFTADQSFASNAINVGSFSLRSIGNPPAGTNKIVADSSDGTVNGTPFATMFLDKTSSVELAFTHPALAFGADFLSSSNAYNLGIFLHGDRAPIFIAGPATGQQYFGVISTSPIDRVEFLYSGQEGSATVNFDDVGISSVPEPSSLMVLGVMAALFATYSCWRLRRGTVDVGQVHS